MGSVAGAIRAVARNRVSFGVALRAIREIACRGAVPLMS
jgi:hypothetical protein